MTETVSYSELVKFDTCKRAYYYNFSLGLKPATMSDAIATGVNGHRLLQACYNCLSEGMTKEQAIEQVTHVANKEAGSHSNTPNFNLLKAWVLVTNFIRTENFTSEAILVENRFQIAASTFTDDPFFENVMIGFTPDVVFKKKGDFVVIEDAKFVERIWAKSKVDRYTQTKMYQIFLNAMGYNVSSSAIRFFNTKDAKIEKIPITLEKGEITNLIHDFLEATREVITYRNLEPEILQRSRRTQNTGNCQFCSYKEPCGLQAKGKDATATLTYGFVKNDYDYNR